MLKTKRLLIRRFENGDGKDLYAYLSDPAVVRYEPYGVWTLEDCIKEAARRGQDESFYAVCLNDTKRLIGNLYFERQKFDTYELGYVFNAAYQGKGYAYESAHALMGYAFQVLMARRIIAKCDPRNEKSWRLLERLGMRREGHLIQSGFFKRDDMGRPLWHDTYEYALLCGEWENGRSQGTSGRIYE